jgi:phosphopantothenoylcysteine synthetase/decarboxylase
MNGRMWDHPATKRNVAALRADGCHFVGPEETGMLACGYEGAGRLAAVETILETLATMVPGGGK